MTTITFGDSTSGGTGREWTKLTGTSLYFKMEKKFMGVLWRIGSA